MKAIYIRTSTEEQNPENQLKDCISLSGNEYELYKDQQSAFKDNVERKDFNRLKLHIKQGKVLELYVWDFDRIYRNRINLKAFLEYCKMHKCKLHSFNQRWLEDIHKVPEPWNEIVYEMLINVFGWIAEEESAHKSKRVKAAIRKKENGTYSYKGKKWGKPGLSTFKINRIRELHKEGLSIRQISKELGVSVGGVHKTIHSTPIHKKI